MENNNEKTVKTSNKKVRNKRALMKGSYSLIISAVVIAIVIVINLLVGQIPTKYTNLDVTASQVYDLSDTTLNMLSGVTDSVTINILVESGNEDSTTNMVKELANRYASENSNISVVMVDPGKNPTFISTYTSASLSSNSMIIVSDKRNTTISADDLFKYSTDYGEFSASEYNSYSQYYDLGDYQYLFYGESLITSAVDYVTTDSLPVIYSVTGHGETDLDDTYQGYITSENMSLNPDDSSLNLTSSTGIPDDCDILLINCPTADITEAELTVLEDYYNAGGNVVLTTYWTYYSQEAMPNLTAFAKLAGIESIDGIILEGDSNYFSQYTNYLMPEVSSDGPMALLESSNINPLMPNSHGLESVSDTEATVYSLLTTSSSSYVKTNFDTESSDPVTDYEEGDVMGPVDVAEASETTNEDDSTSRFAWFASPYITDSSADQSSSYANSSVFTSTLEWMVGKSTSISIVGKDMSATTTTLDEGTISVWTLVLVVLVPVAFLVIGFVRWISRRKH